MNSVSQKAQGWFSTALHRFPQASGGNCGKQNLAQRAFFAVFPFLTQESSRVFHAFHGVFNISTVDNPYTRWITFPEYTECERYVKLYRQKKLDANNSPII